MTINPQDVAALVAKLRDDAYQGAAQHLRSWMDIDLLHSATADTLEDLIRECESAHDWREQAKDWEQRWGVENERAEKAEAERDALAARVQQLLNHCACVFQDGKPVELCKSHGDREDYFQKMEAVVEAARAVANNNEVFVGDRALRFAISTPDGDKQ